jgi:hypothetical protein
MIINTTHQINAHQDAYGYERERQGRSESSRPCIFHAYLMRRCEALRAAHLKRSNSVVRCDSQVNTSEPLFETFRYARLPPRRVMARPVSGRPRESAWLKICSG